MVDLLRAGRARAPVGPQGSALTLSLSTQALDEAPSDVPYSLVVSGITMGLVPEMVEAAVEGRVRQ